MRYTIRDSSGVYIATADNIQKASDIACSAIGIDNPAAQVIDSGISMAFRFTVFASDDYISGFVGTQYRDNAEAFNAITKIMKG